MQNRSEKGNLKSLNKTRVDRDCKCKTQKQRLITNERIT